MNAFPLIRRKLVPARIPEPHVNRPKLVATLALGLEPSRRLTVVCGGPGYGKSTLVAAYLKEADVPACWYGLDESDADLITFVSYLVGTLKARFPAMGDRVMELVRSAPSLEAVLQTVMGLLAEEMTEIAEDGAILVLDDFHAVGQVGAILKATEYLVQYMPDNWQLILTTREQPQLSLPQLRVRQQLVEIGVRELRFNAQDLRDLLQKLCGVSLSDAEALELVGHTDGWVASVILAAQAVRGAGEEAKALLLKELDEPVALYDYLAQEVFNRQDAAMQKFLVESALLPEVDAASCREALGAEDAAERIRLLIQGNLLLPEDTELRTGGPEGYAYHPSFRRFLLARLEETRPAAALAELYIRISRYLAAEQPEEALTLAMRAGDLDAAAGLLAAQAATLIANNQLERLRLAIERFPADYQAGSYTLSFSLGELQRLWGNFDQAVGLFQRASELALSDARPDLRGRALVHLAAIGLGRGDTQAPALLAEGEALLAADDLTARSFAANLRGAGALSTNQNEQALAAYEESLAGYRQLGDPVGQAKVLNNLGLCYTRFGRFDAAIATYREAIAQSELAGRYPHPMTLNNLAFIYCYQGRFQEAWQAAERALDVSQLLKAKRDAVYAHLALGSANVGLGDRRRAEEHFTTSRDEARTLGDRVVGAKAYQALAELVLLAGQVPRAMALLEEGIALMGVPLEDPRQGDLAILMGQLKLEAGDYTQAETILSRLEAEFEALSYRYRQAQVAFYRARLASKRGDADAEARWRSAAKLAEAHGYSYLLETESAHRGPAPAAVAPAPERAAMPAAIRIQCFGGMQVQVGDRLVPNRDWRGFKTKLILAYLLAHPDGVTKEQLTDLLYAEIDTTRTATLVLISRLRHALEPEMDKQTPSRFVHFVDGKYTFNFAMPFQLDTAEFEYHYKQGQDTAQPLEARRTHWREALAIYQGPYLSDVTAADCPWLTVVQEGYRRMAQEIHMATIRSYLEAGDLASALASAEANLAFDACSEFAHQVKMICLSRLDQREGALRHWGVMKQIFERELGLPPSRESQQVYEAISRGGEAALPR